MDEAKKADLRVDFEDRLEALFEQAAEVVLGNLGAILAGDKRLVFRRSFDGRTYSDQGLTITDFEVLVLDKAAPPAKVVPDCAETGEATVEPTVERYHKALDEAANGADIVLLGGDLPRLFPDLARMAADRLGVRLVLRLAYGEAMPPAEWYDVADQVEQDSADRTFRVVLKSRPEIVAAEYIPEAPPAIEEPAPAPEPVAAYRRRKCGDDGLDEPVF